MKQKINPNGYRAKVKFIEKQLRNYKSIKASIINMEQELEELSPDGIGAIAYDKPSISETYAISSMTENEAVNIIEKKEELEQKIQAAKRKIEKLDRGIESLGEVERVIVEKTYFEGLKYYSFIYRIYVSERSAKRIKQSALGKLIIAYYGEDVE